MADEKEELRIENVKADMKASRLAREENIECLKNKLEELSQEIKNIQKYYDPQANFYYKIESFIKSLNKSKDMIESAAGHANDIGKLNHHLKNLKYGN